MSPAKVRTWVMVAGLMGWLATPVTAADKAASGSDSFQIQEALKAASRSPELVIILDCSHSMSELVTDAAGNQTTRMEEAKRAVERLLADLPTTGDRKVGVLFFGHRAAMNLAAGNGPPEVVLQKKFLIPPPEKLQPREDVEAILKLDVYGRKQRERALAALETVRPWGETPLYRSIREGLAEFPAADGQSQQIVVITDEPNFVPRPADDKEVTKEVLIEAIKKRPVPVHFVGFHVDARHLDKAQSEFSEIGKACQGSFESIGGRDKLISHLRKLAGLSK